MKQSEFPYDKIPPALLRDWRGHPLYIIATYLRGQLMLTLPAFLVAMIFTRIIARVIRYDLASMVTVVVALVTAMAYIFYHRYSTNIRAFLSTLIAGISPDQELATRAWIEAINFPPFVVGGTILVAILAYGAQAIYFFLTTEFRLAIELQGWIVSLALTVAIALVFFLLYLERTMYPVTLLALAMGAQASLDDSCVYRFRLRPKLLVLILPIMIVPLVTLGLFGYSQAVILGGDPTTSLLLTGVVVIFSGGVLIRKMSAQAAMERSLEGALFAGLLGGTWVGAGTGFAIGLTCFFIGETVSLPLYTSAGLATGFIYSKLERGGAVWSYSLNPFLAVYNFLERLFHRSLDRNFVPLLLSVGFALLRYRLLGRYGTEGLIYGYPTRDWFFITLDLTVLAYTLGVALKLAANTRGELIHREEEKQLVHARLTTLRSQINPHFLFNTLNSITSLIRTDAERAREMTRRLSSIFRKSLDETGDAHSLANEVDFLDDYLSIERVRFGDERFEVVKELDEGTLGVQVPALLLQPLVENAVKHGIACRTEGGRVTIRSAVVRGGIEITIENDGPETGPLEMDSLFSEGVGLRNVAERLDIFTCGEGRMEIASRPGGGAVVRLFIPDSAGRGKEVAGTGVDSRR